MKKLFMMICAVALSVIGAAAQQRYAVKGELEHIYNGNMVYLTTDDNGVRIDSTRVDNGSFSFSGVVAYPVIASVSVKGAPVEAMKSMQIVLDDSDIFVNLITHTLKGSKANEHLSAMNKAVADIYMDLGRQHKDEAATMTQEEKMVLLGSILTEVQKKTLPVYEQAALDNTDNVIAGYLLSKHYREFKEQTLAYIVEHASASLLTDENYKNFLTVYEGMLRGSVGGRYTDFVMKTPEGKTTAISSLMKANRYLFVDFWASWCGPCRGEIPYIKDVYQRYHAKGLDIVSVSLDNSKKAWTDAIASLDLPWVHISDLRGWQSECVKIYGISGIPFSILIAPDGTIIAKNLRGEGLNEKMMELFK
ncbi:MAG: AhpC/TSA family protein [Prevotella sp.]|nr:AhpC/TSA family protein [Prevotella sp.]